MRYINIVIAVLLLNACVKEDDGIKTIAEGYVYHSGTKKPLEGVTVYLYDGLPGSNKGSRRIDSTHTDAFGFFHVELKAEEPVLDLYNENFDFEYVIGGAGIGIVPLNIGNNLNLKFEMDAWAYINPWFQGKNSTSTDTVLFDLLSNQGFREGWLSTFYGNGPHHFGNSFNGYLTKGDTYKAYWLKYQIKGEWHERKDSVYVPSFTTWADTIFY